jgi:Spy/CpxP family protein refolding chaperone
MMTEYKPNQWRNTMKKILSMALILGTTALMAYPMGQGMMQGGMGGGMCGGGLMEKCQCDTKQLPRALEALDLSEKQKEQIVKLREEGQAFHNKQREKMLNVLTPDQRGKLDYMQKLRELKRADMGSAMPMSGMGCKNCQ